MTNSTELKRELHFWDSVAINIGIIIGVGIFRTPSRIAEYLTSPHLIIFAWVLGGLIACIGALCYAELASRHPKTGGTYVFLREAYGKLTSFLFGWTEIVILRAGSIAAVAYVFSAYLKNFIPLGPWSEKWIAIGLIGILTVINILGVKLGARVQQVFSSLKILTLFGITAAVFLLFHQLGDVGAMWKGAAENQPTQNFLLLFTSALVPILWTYGGWHESAFMSGEFRDTKRALPLSIITSALVVMAFYVLVNIAYLCVISPLEMVNTKAIAASVIDRLFGHSGSAFISLAVLISATGALNSTIMTGGRIPFAVAKDYPKFSWFSEVDSKLGTPKRSLILNSIWAAVLILFGNFEDLLSFCQFAQWLFFALAGASLFLAKSSRVSHDGFQTPLHPLFPILFTGIGTAFCISIIWNFPGPSGIGIGLILIGLPIYYFLKH